MKPLGQYGAPRELALDRLRIDEKPLELPGSRADSKGSDGALSEEPPASRLRHRQPVEAFCQRANPTLCRVAREREGDGCCRREGVEPLPQRSDRRRGKDSIREWVVRANEPVGLGR